MLYFLYRKYIIGKDGILLLEGVFVTITGFRNYYDKIPFSIGARFLCAKEPGNAYDTEAIRVLAPNGHTVGYVANSVHTKANGTMSAARVYDRVGDLFWVEVCFSTQSKIICQITDFDVPKAAATLPLLGRRSEDEWDAED